MRGALGDVWSDLWTVLVCDFIWLVGVVLILPGPPVTLALFTFANRQVHGETADLKEFWLGLRRYWLPAWRWGAINLVALVLFIGDVYFTGRGDPTPIMRFLQTFYLAGMFAWLVVQLYSLPFLLEQTNPSVIQAMRNGLVMLGQNAIFSISLGVLLLLICLAGIPLFFLTVGFGPMFLAFAANRAVLMKLGSE